MNRASVIRDAVKPTVLIVDDKPANIDLLVDVLKDDYSLKVSLNGPHALEVAQDTPPDIILLDIMMPGMDGYEVCRRLKSNDKTRAIPVIFVTAKVHCGDETKGLECGAVDYITKPVNAAIVRARLKNHLALFDQTRMLEGMVREKTAQLRASRDKAEAASRAKSAFLRNMSHELRTPLNHILGFATLLMTEDDEEQRLEMAQLVSDSALSLNHIFGQVLELSELESNDFKMTEQRFEIGEFLAEQGAKLKHYAREAGLEMDVAVQDDIPEALLGDPDAVAKLLSILIRNACRYSDGGAISLDVRIDPDHFADAGRYDTMVRFCVTDTGIGIPEEKLETIFDSFEIGEDYMIKRLSGAGVGLSIAKALVKALEGAIWVKSEPGKGSSFFISIPFKVAG